MGAIKQAETPMALQEYLLDVVRDMQLKSAAVRRDFSSHHLSAGENREGIVAQFLECHLPQRFGVSSGLVISHDGMFSNQADLVIVDHLNNAPLHGTSKNKLWPVEAVYALIEVKTSLTPTELADAVAKCRKFKALQRRFCPTGETQRTTDSLFVIWAFGSAAPPTFKTNLAAALGSVPRAERPDFVVVPDRLVATAGTYLEVSQLGQVGSSFRTQLHAKHGASLDSLLPEPAQVVNFGDNSLLAWYAWFDSWLRQAGSRFSDPVAYITPNAALGQVV
jgi:hypothetical protein